jgi:hypothetical protein
MFGKGKSNFKTASKNAKKKFGKKGKPNPFKKGMGFKKAQENIMASGKSKDAAGAILASAARKASPSAKKRNPNLKKVK